MSKISHDSEILKKGQQVITVCGFVHRKINDEIQVFLPKRAATKKFLPSVYEMPGGHVDFGEDLVDALKREVMEELDQELTVGDPFWAFTYQNLIKQSHSVEVIFLAKFTEEDPDIKLNPEDHSEYGWFNEEEVRTIVAKNRSEGRRFNSVNNNTNSDLELESILKGFSVLKGEPLNFG